MSEVTEEEFVNTAGRFYRKIKELKAALAKTEEENKKHCWMPVGEHPKNDTYYMALIGDTGDDFGNTLEWLYFNESWFYAKTKKPYPRTMFIVQYMRISLPCSEPREQEQEQDNEQ